MKNKKMLESMNLIDDRFIEEAKPEALKPRRRGWVAAIAAVACFCLAISSIGIYQLLQKGDTPPDVTIHEGDEYYDIIEKLNTLLYSNNDKNSWWDSLVGTGDMAPTAPGDIPEDDMFEEGVAGGSPSGDQTYEEITDNQVAGVIEADIIKRSNEYIYYLRGDLLSIYSIEGEESREVGNINYATLTGVRQYDFSNPQMYLSSDCKTITIIVPYSSKVGGAQIEIVSLGVEDPANIRIQKRASISGAYTSSRLIDGKLLLLNEYYASNEPDFYEPSTFIPQIDTGAGLECIPEENIYCPDVLTSRRYTVVTLFDEATLDVLGCSAFLSYSNTIYVSENAIYATRQFHDNNRYGEASNIRKTEISRLAYSGDEFTFGGSVMVDGWVKDQYSLDEHDGQLRVVTTTNYAITKETVSTDGNNVTHNAIVTGATNANLYCVDISNMQISAEVKSFAPNGESVQSVRFDGNMAYVCTSIVLSDPVFFFDLSDINNITWRDTGTIEGYSSSLINIGGGFLLGIGLGDWNTVKIEVYEECADGVRSVCKYEVEDTHYSTEYKSYLVDRENKLIGLGVTDYTGKYNDDRGRYILLYFDNYNLIELVNTELGGADTYKRAVYIDGYLYMFSPMKSIFKVMKV